MKESHKFDDVLKRLQQCLKELGFDAETKISKHEGIVFARKEIEGECVRVVAHVSDRVVQAMNVGAPNPELRKARVAQMAIRPSLANQAASRYAPPQDQQNEPCD